MVTGFWKKWAGFAGVWAVAFSLALLAHGLGASGVVILGNNATFKTHPFLVKATSSINGRQSGREGLPSLLDADEDAVLGSRHVLRVRLQGPPASPTLPGVRQDALERGSVRESGRVSRGRLPAAAELSSSVEGAEVVVPARPTDVGEGAERGGLPSADVLEPLSEGGGAMVKRLSSCGSEALAASPELWRDFRDYGILPRTYDVSFRALERGASQVERFVPVAQEPFAYADEKLRQIFETCLSMMDGLDSQAELKVTFVIGDDKL